MRSFLRHIALFSVPFCVLLAVLLSGHYDKSYAYHAIQKDCRSGDWMYQRLFENTTPIDIAFVGTSKTMCDVNDALLQERLARESGIQAEIANFGVCRTGENLHYLIARDLLEQKKPRYLIYELSAHLDPGSHFHFPNVASAGDAFAAPIWYNDDYFSDIGKLTWTRLVYQREKLLGIDREYENILNDADHSFMVVENDLVADSAHMARTKVKRKDRLSTAPPTGLVGLAHRASRNFPRQYLLRLSRLCEAYGTQLVFLYLPRYGAPGNVPRYHDFYTDLAPVLLPPDSIFGNPTLHFDDSHLNQRGARLFSDWLLENIGGLLQK